MECGGVGVEMELVMRVLLADAVGSGADKWVSWMLLLTVFIGAATPSSILLAHGGCSLGGNPGGHRKQSGSLERSERNAGCKFDGGGCEELHAMQSGSLSRATEKRSSMALTGGAGGCILGGGNDMCWLEER